MKLSQKRRDAIYGAVDRRLMDLRIEVALLTNDKPALGTKLDNLLYRAQLDAAAGAVEAAEQETAKLCQK